MFNDVTLVVVGDSFVFGHYGDDVGSDDESIRSCWNRSWVKKLEKIAGFKNSINLSAPGGSNTRSVRKIMNFFSSEYSPEEKYFVIFAGTTVSRIELPILPEDLLHYKLLGVASSSINQLENSSKFASALGVWTVDQIKRHEDPAKWDKNKILEFLDTYYGIFFDIDYSICNFKHQIILMHTFLNSLNIPHYFMQTMSDFKLDDIQMLDEELPIIRLFNQFGLDVALKQFLEFAGFEKGPCDHFDHDGNQFVAEYIYNNYFKELKND